MSRSATPTDRLHELDEGTWRAWRNYCDSTQSLTGEAYERAELESWSILQSELRRLERARPELTPPRV